MAIDSRSKPIGVFDSGVGGLTVLKQVIARLPHESTVYLGDTARVPYGTKSGEVVTRYSLANAAALMEHGIKALVVACNTASAVALPALRRELPIPVIGVIEPGAAAAVKATRTHEIAVIGTPGTIASGAYQTALKTIDPQAQIHARPCPMFVPLAEEGWLEGDVPRLIAERYLRGGLMTPQTDTLVLGCTHYPLLSSVIQQVVGPGVTLVDSAHATADALVTALTTLNLLAHPGSTVHRRYLVTDTPARFVGVAQQFLGWPIEGAQQVDLHVR